MGRELLRGFVINLKSRVHCNKVHTCMQVRTWGGVRGFKHPPSSALFLVVVVAHLLVREVGHVQLTYPYPCIHGKLTQCFLWQNKIGRVHYLPELYFGFKGLDLCCLYIMYRHMRWGHCAPPPKKKKLPM